MSTLQSFCKFTVFVVSIVILAACHPFSQKLVNTVASAPSGGVSGGVPAPVPNAVGKADRTFKQMMGVSLVTPCRSWDVMRYTYPAQMPLTEWDMDYYKSRGFDLIRLALQWEALQPVLNGPLDPTALQCVSDMMKMARDRNMKLVLSIMNFGRYDKVNHGLGSVGNTGSILGSSDLPPSAFKDFWTKLATVWAGHAEVYGYDLMNEPHDMGDASYWPVSMQAAVDGIRSVDKETMLVIEGDGWSGAMTWQQLNGNLKVNDPSNNYVFEAHQYFDYWGAGVYNGTYDSEGAYPMIGVDRVKPFVDWIKQNKYNGYVGEYVVPPNTTDQRWLVVMDNFMKYIVENGLSGTAWCGGALNNLWHNPDATNLEPVNAENWPANLQDKAIMAVLTKYPSPTLSGPIPVPAVLSAQIPTFTPTVTLSATSVQNGQTLKITDKILTSAPYRNAIVQTEIYDAAGNRVAFQANAGHAWVLAGSTESQDYDYTVNLGPGQYMVAISIFSPGYGQNLAWIGNLAKFSVN